MARLIVGMEQPIDIESDRPIDADRQLTLNIGARTIDLAPQHLESDGISWYWAEVDDDDQRELLEALAATPGVASSYVQAPEASP